MAYLLGLSMALVPYILGKGALRLLYGGQGRKFMNRADNLPVGFMMVIGLAEMAHLGAIVFGRSYSDCRNLFLILLAVCLLAAVLVLCIGKRDRKVNLPPIGKEQTCFVLFGIVVLLQVVVLIVGRQVYTTGDMTVETINTMRSTDSLYQVNPMTGHDYELGMPMRLKVLCLPTLYAILSDVSGLSPMEVVWVVVPVVILLVGYVAYYSLSRILFPKERKKRILFLLFVALILQVGNYLFGMDGFGIQYAGYRGVSIRAAILIPYTWSLILRKQWKLVILCILAEACIVWTLYGMGTCLLIAVIMAILQYPWGKMSLPDKRREET